jgi:Mg2+/Co2+ transporter CorB
MQAADWKRLEDGSVVVDGAASLRDLNRQLGYAFPVDGPKTLNGLLLEHLQEIPEPGTSLKVAGNPVEILQVQHRSIKSVRLPSPKIKDKNNK